MLAKQSSVYPSHPVQVPFCPRPGSALQNEPVRHDVVAAQVAASSARVWIGWAKRIASASRHVVNIIAFNNFGQAYGYENTSLVGMVISLVLLYASESNYSLASTKSVT